MADIKTFSDTVIQALDEKSQWYDSEELPAMLENYRMLHTCVKNLYDFLLKKSLIKKDPYKLDKKISDIVAPENSNFSENDRSLVVGMRFSDYDSTLDFLCNYYKFSVDRLTLGTIKKLVDFNSSFLWNAFTPNSPKANTRGLAGLLSDGKQGGDQFTLSLITDSVSKAGKALTSITDQLKKLTEFQKELYKGNVRRNVFAASGFDMEAASRSADEELSQIKKHFAGVMGKVPFYAELISELVQEDHAPNKDELQQIVLAKLNVKTRQEENKKPEIDTKELLMDSVRMLGAMPAQINAALQKINENHDVLESEHNTFMNRLKAFFRKAFKIPEKPLYYQIIITDEATDTKRRDKLNYQDFVSSMQLRARRFAAAATKESPGYARIYAQPEEKILEFVNNQIFDSSKMIKILNGLDEYFKQAVQPQNKSKIKGLKMEVTSLKNCLVKANQCRADYTAYVEEEAQFKKLGIDANES
ncbi:MAG: hypothetical protein K6G80_04145 [Treponema sp.]|nr:hypothetical protein [Treponema sp.]